MRPDEQLDEAIERVAARMTAAKTWQGIELHLPASRVGRWRPRRLAMVGLVAMLLVAAIARPRPVPVLSPVAADITLTSPSSAAERPAALVLPDVAIAPSGRESRSRASAPRVAVDRVLTAIQEQREWGLPSMDVPEALALVPMNVTPLQLDDVDVTPVIVPGLAIDDIPAGSGSKEYLI